METTMEDPLATDSRTKDTFALTLRNFSQLEDRVLSPPFMIRNLPWQIIITPRSNNNYVDHWQKSVGFYLQCNGDSENSSWSCHAEARLTILSQIEGVEDFTRIIRYSFSWGKNDCGFPMFCPWNDVTNPDFGYIENDTVIFQAQVIAEAPDGTNLDCKKRRSGIFLKNPKKVCDKPFQNLSLINPLTKVPETDSAIVENVTFLQVYVTDLKDATEKGDTNSIENLLELIRARISVMRRISVKDVTDWIKGQVKEALISAKVEIDKAEDILKQSKKSSADSPSNSHTRIRIDWNPVPFCGKTDEWCHWWRIFESVIHKNETIDEEIKMKALAECLKDDANDVLGDMPKTGEYYQRAVAQLQNQYSDARILRQTYYDQLERVAPANDLPSQRETVTELRTIVQNLDALRKMLPIDDDVIICNIVQKFPNEVLRCALASLKPSKLDITFQPTPAELLGALEAYLPIEEFITTCKMEISKTQNCEISRCLKLEPNSDVPVDVTDDHGSED